MPSTVATWRFDEIDQRILEALQNDASLENQQLAQRVHLSAAACLRRVRRLRDSGVITRIVALLDPAQLGLEVHAYAFVTLENQHISSAAQLETMAKKQAEVMECIRLSGDYDYLLRVVVPSMSAYSAFLDRYVLPLPAVRSVNTSFELAVFKRTTALPVTARVRTRERTRAR